MQQEQKFDINTIIGFSLITVILIGFMYWNSLQAEKMKEQEKEQVTATKKEKTKPTQVKETVVQVPEDSLDSVQIQTQNQVINLNNEDITLEVNSKGGGIKSLRLNKHYAYSAKGEGHKKPLYLIKNGNSQMNIELIDNQGVRYNLSQLDFAPKKNGEQLALTTNLNGAQITLAYILKDNYQLDLQISSKGWAAKSGNKNAVFNWDMKGFALEKGRQQALIYSDQHYRFKGSDDVEYDRGEYEEEDPIDWVSFKQQFFANTLFLKDGFEKVSGKTEDAPENDSLFIKHYSFKGEIADSHKELDANLEFAFVPLKHDLLSKGVFEKRNYDEIIPFGLWGGSGFIAFINKHFFLNVFKWLASTGLQYGWVIFLMTIVVKLIFSPLMYRQYRQSAMMKVLKPEMEEINKKYPGQDNAMKRQQETMALQRKAGVNMLAGCVPALIQLPLFYALFRLFPNLFELRGKSFLFAEDLTSYDSIINLGFEIPFLGSHISIFALGYVAVMIIYFRVSGSMDNFANQAPPQEGMPDMRFMKYFMYVMPIFFFVFLNNYSSGLSWYYLVSNGINIGLVMFIKNVMLDEEKIHQRVQENKKKPKKQSKLGKKFSDLMEQAQTEQQRREKGKGKK